MPIKNGRNNVKITTDTSSIDLTTSNILITGGTSFGGFRYSATPSNTDDRSVLDRGQINAIISATVSNIKRGSLSFALDGNGADIVSGTSALITYVMNSGVITNWIFEGEEPTGSISVDVQRWNGASYSTIVGGGNRPTITAAKYATASVSGWTSTTLSVGDRIRFSVVSSSAFSKANLQVLYTKN